ncbi:MAG: glycosyltransferase family 2 protein, partial [Ruminococcus flavefaciens]|nr:glycosyltransferase family 2 protein [Ruminococcus flavefaciens]
FPSAAGGFHCLALAMNARLAMQAVEEGVTEGRLSDYLRRFRENVRKHISFRTLRLCPDMKSLAAALALAVGVPVFYGLASVYRVVKRWRRRDNGL